jgi:hypothetical protein
MTLEKISGVIYLILYNLIEKMKNSKLYLNISIVSLIFVVAINTIYFMYNLSFYTYLSSFIFFMLLSIYYFYQYKKFESF